MEYAVYFVCIVNSAYVRHDLLGTRVSDVTFISNLFAFSTSRPVTTVSKSSIEVFDNISNDKLI